MTNPSSERDPLLLSAAPAARGDESARRKQRGSSSDNVKVGWVAVFGVVLFALVWVTTFSGIYPNRWEAPKPGQLPKDPLARAKVLLERHPLVDGHIDLPIQARARFANQIGQIDLNDPDFPLHVSIPKLREGRVGGFFWSAYVPCAETVGLDEGKDFVNATWRVRDTLEQIDISKLLIEKHSDTFELALSANGIRGAFAKGKIASLIGLEGGHQLGSSLAVLRQYYELGVRYVTLTHICNNAFAGSCGFEGRPIENYGLTSLGEKLVLEMNRIGMLVDVSHTSIETVRDVLRTSKAPVIFSHSNAAAVWDVPRNVPDSILESLNRGGNAEALVMATFAPQFVSQHEDGRGHKATLDKVADHIEHIASKVGRDHVGIGSDFDGIQSTPTGLEDVSKYPYLLAELIRRGWSDDDIIGLAGGNLIRIFERVEGAAAARKHKIPDTTLYHKRRDLPMR